MLAGRGHRVQEGEWGVSAFPQADAGMEGRAGHRKDMSVGSVGEGLNTGRKLGECSFSPLPDTTIQSLPL